MNSRDELGTIAELLRIQIPFRQNYLNGHNRYRICTEHNIPYTTVSKDFDDRNATMLWMMNNQLSRRNLNDFQRVEIVRKCESAVKAQAEKRKSPGTNQYTDRPVGKLPQGSTSMKSRDELGAIAGVSGKTYEHTDKVKKLYGDDRQTKADSIKTRQRRRLKLETLRDITLIYQ